MKNHSASHKIQLITSQIRQSQHKQKMLSLNIYQQDTCIATLLVSKSGTVLDLMNTLRQKLSGDKFPASKFLCLESMDNREVLDYSLLIDSFKLENYQDDLDLRLVISENVASRSEISLNDFWFKKCLGQGASAIVSLVRHKSTGKMYALKQISKTYFTEFKRMQQVLRQKKIMSEVINDFPFIAKLFASFQSQDHLNFLLEFYPGGEMFFHLHERRLSQRQAKIYFAELVVTFQFLHQKNIIYRDLKPENIMIDFYGHTKLTDFGLCKINLGKEDLTTSYCGSIQYMAPQVKDSIGYSFSADYYTLGAFLYEMVVGVPPYYNTTRLVFQEKNSEFFKELVQGLIQDDVSNRIGSFQQIKNSKFMADVNWQEIYDYNIKAPYEIQVSKTYIHDEFKEISVDDMNIVHQEQYDRLFSFFTFLKNDESNLSFTNCYHIQQKEKEDKYRKMSKKMQWPGQKEKKKKEKSSKSKSKSSEKSQNKSRRKDVNDKKNIYTTNNLVTSPYPLRFKKAAALVNSKSVKDVLKTALGRI